VRIRRLVPKLGRIQNWSTVVGVLIAVGTVVVIAFHNSLAPYNWSTPNIGQALQGPSLAHLLGTDELGRDELSMVMAGYPYSIGVGAVGASVAAFIGLTIAVLASAWPRWARIVVERTSDAAIAMPFLVIAVVAIVVVGDGFWQTAIVLGVVTWPLVARVALAEARVVLAQEYVLCAQLMGVRPLRRVLRHVLPEVLRSVVVMLPFLLSALILLEAALSVVGLGAPLGSASWGSMLASSEDYLRNAPWLMGGPALALVVTVLAANLLGDALSRWGVDRSGIPPEVILQVGQLDSIGAE
jgi:peptide/nickel transport system permease protein